MTVLSVQQLSDSAKYRFRYQVLSKIGLGRREIQQTVFRQLSGYYLCPAILSAVISGIVAVYMGAGFNFYTGVSTPVLQYFAISFALFFGVYVVYFGATMSDLSEISKNENGEGSMSRNAIKYLAMAAMFCNHFAYIFLKEGSTGQEVMVDIGYFTAITMCYFLVEGYHYTRSVKNYALRLLAFGILSQIPFMLALKQTNLNMMFSLLLCLGVVWVADHVNIKGRKCYGCACW